MKTNLLVLYQGYNNRMLDMYSNLLTLGQFNYTSNQLLAHIFLPSCMETIEDTAVGLQDCNLLSYA